VGDVDGDVIKRQMIKRTIEEHLKKELRLRSQGIKVLSLFFIDKWTSTGNTTRRATGNGQVRIDV
jgi:restriction endonuclease